MLEEAIETNDKDIVEYLMDFNALTSPADQIEGTKASSVDVQRP